MDKFDKILLDQKTFNEMVIGKTISELSISEKMYWIKEYALCMQSEILDFLKETGNYKIHRVSGTECIKSNVREELTDIFKYFMSLMIMSDINFEDMITGYFDKSIVVKQRYKQEHAKFKKIAVIDIDGTVCDYVKQFCDFVERKTGFNCWVIEDVPIDIYCYLGSIIGVSEVMKLKHEFRMSGEKRWISAYPGAADTVNLLKQKGYSIFFLTARPFKRYKRMWGDTIYWLDSNGFYYDAILSNDDKNFELMPFIDDVEIIIDDSKSQIDNLSMFNKKCFLISKDDKLTCADNIKVIKDITCIVDCLT